VSVHSPSKSDSVARSQVCRCNCISHHLCRKSFSNVDFLSTRRGWITMPWPDLLLVLWHSDRCLLRPDVAKSYLKPCDITDLFHSRLMSAGRKISNGVSGRIRRVWHSCKVAAKCLVRAVCTSELICSWRFVHANTRSDWWNIQSWM